MILIGNQPEQVGITLLRLIAYHVEILQWGMRAEENLGGTAAKDKNRTDRMRIFFFPEHQQGVFKYIEPVFRAYCSQASKTALWLQSI